MRFIAVLNVLYNHFHCPHNHYVSLFYCVLTFPTSIFNLRNLSVVTSLLSQAYTFHYIHMYNATIVGKAQVLPDFYTNGLFQTTLLI